MTLMKTLQMNKQDAIYHFQVSIVCDAECVNLLNYCYFTHCMHQDQIWLE